MSFFRITSDRGLFRFSVSYLKPFLGQYRQMNLGFKLSLPIFIVVIYPFIFTCRKSFTTSSKVNSSISIEDSHTNECSFSPYLNSILYSILPNSLFPYEYYYKNKGVGTIFALSFFSGFSHRLVVWIKQQQPTPKDMYEANIGCTNL